MASATRRGRLTAAWEGRGTGVRGVIAAWELRERGVSTTWRRPIVRSSLRGRGVTAAWKWRFVLVDALCFVLDKLHFWFVVSQSTVSRNILSLQISLKQNENLL